MWLVLCLPPRRPRVSESCCPRLSSPLPCPPPPLSLSSLGQRSFITTMTSLPAHPCGLMFSGKPSKETIIISGLCPHLPCHPPPTLFLQSHLPVILAPGHDRDRNCPRGTRHPPPTAGGDNCVGPPVGAVPLGGASVLTNRIPSPQYIFVRTAGLRCH